MKLLLLLTALMGATSPASAQNYDVKERLVSVLSTDDRENSYYNYDENKFNDDVLIAMRIIKERYDLCKEEETIYGI